MSDTEPASRVLVEGFTAVRKNSLRGYTNVVLPTGMTLCGVAVYVSGDEAWVAPPSRPMLSPQGAAMRDGSGKIRYAHIITFASRETRDRFSENVVAALKVTHPEAFEP